MKHILAYIFVLCSLCCHAQVSKIDNELVVYKEFITIGYDTCKHIPNWVYEKHTPKSLIGKAKRISSFYKEESIPNCISESIYKNSGYDKGHMAPAADFKFSDKAMYESFSIANVAPQRPRLNRIYWYKLEQKIREIIDYADTTYIITGHMPNLYNKDKIKNKVYIPCKFFKAIYAIKDRKCVCSISFILENSNEKQDYIKCKYTINYLENSLKRDLFMNISKESYESKIIFPYF